MAGEVKPIRENTRKVKNHIINRYLKLADRVDAKGDGDLSENELAKYWELTTIFAKSVLPRTQEVTGEDGAPISLVFDKTFQNASDTPSETAGDSKVQSQV